MSKSGFGLSVGPRGASMSFGPSGTYTNLDLPGGFSLRDRVGGTSQQTSASSSKESQTANMKVTVSVEEDGVVNFKDKDGNLLPPHLQDLTKKQQGNVVKALLTKCCDEINEKIDSLDTIHLATPSSSQKPIYSPIPFTSEPPLTRSPKKLGIWGHLFPWVKKRIEADNATAEAEYGNRLHTWKDCKAKHEKAETDRRVLLQERLYKEPEAMHMVLQQRLEAVQWPRETSIAIEISESGSAAIIDVDLPEIEDCPRKTATYSGRGWKVGIKDLSDSKLTQLYMRHVHAIGFRILGETFAALPTIQDVVLSGYSQRPNKANGQITDEYLYSVKASRESWSKLQFDNLQAIDVTECLAQFELRRDMSKSGRFKAVEPFARFSQETESK